LFGSDAEAAGIAAQLDLDGDGKVRPVHTISSNYTTTTPYVQLPHVLRVPPVPWFVRCRCERWWNTPRPRRARRTWRYGTLHTAAAYSWRRGRATPLSHMCPALPRVVFFSWSLVRCWKTCSRSRASSTAPTHTRPPPPPLLPPLPPPHQRRRQPGIDQHEASGGALRVPLLVVTAVHLSKYRFTPLHCVATSVSTSQYFSITKTNGHE
jgi:hypothetical protein